MGIFDAVIGLVSAIIPFMVILSIPLTAELFTCARHALYCEDFSQKTSYVRRAIIALSVMIIPYLFGTLGATVLSINSTRTNTLTAGIVSLFIDIGLLVCGFSPIALGYAHRRFVAGSPKDGSHQMFIPGLLISAIPAFLYLSLSLQLFSYWVSPLR